MRSKSHAFVLAVALLAASHAAPIAAAGEAPYNGNPPAAPAQKPDDPLKPIFLCCQYLCSDANGDYRYQTCTAGNCTDEIPGRLCRLTGRFTVDSCKECPHELDRGKGEGGCYGQPDEQGKPADPPGGQGGPGGASKKR